VWTERTSPALAAPFTPADLPPEQRAAVFQAEAEILKAERDRLQQEVGMLRRQLADWQADNPQRRDLAVAPGGYYVTTPAGTALRHADPWPPDNPHEVPVHPYLWPSTREGLRQWNLWARDHPDAAKAALAGMPIEELRTGRKELKAALADVETALAKRTAARSRN
jgi:ribosomal protein L29